LVSLEWNNYLAGGRDGFGYRNFIRLAITFAAGVAVYLLLVFLTSVKIKLYQKQQIDAQLQTIYKDIDMQKRVIKEQSRFSTKRLSIVKRSLSRASVGDEDQN
jgi:uncharacterized membrane-anchored protein YhcB (DUF1043 family)